MAAVNSKTNAKPFVEEQTLAKRKSEPVVQTFVKREAEPVVQTFVKREACLLYTSPSPRDATLSRMPSSA